MDEPINIQGTTRDMLDEPAAALFQHQGQLYRKFVDNNYFYHREVYGRLRGTKEELLRVAQEFGLEGLVAKRLNSVYESGRRSGAWVKYKITKSQEFIIGGYTLPEGSRKFFGPLLVGY